MTKSLIDELSQVKFLVVAQRIKAILPHSKHVRNEHRVEHTLHPLP